MPNVTKTPLKRPWLYDLLFLLIFVLAGYLRTTGVNWGEGQHQHPDENFLTSVLESLRAQKCADETIPVDACPPEQKRWMSLGDYFDGATSTLNPYNRGYSFFVYGNLPMTIVRIAADATNQFDVKILGRQFSSLADLFTIVFLYLIVSRMYGRRVGLLASLFSALTVMQIQQSHFFTTDLFVNAFAFLAIYIAVTIVYDSKQKAENREQEIVSSESLNETIDETQLTTPGIQLPDLKSLVTDHLFLLSLGFGVAFGMALASKVNIYPLAVLLPGAFALRYFIRDRYTVAAKNGSRTPEDSPIIDRRSLITDYWLHIIACLIAGGLAAIISFRIFQPYAFDGLLPSKQWITNIQEQRGQASGNADLPWNLQWVRRNHLYSFENLTIWGLGLPLGILAWAGFLYMGWRILKNELRHALLWGWTATYFLWQSLQFNPNMRYQLPIYPLLAMMAAWFVFELAGLNLRMFKRFNIPKILASTIGLTVIVLTAVWAFAFHSIYTRDEPRIAASRWIFQNVPGPINIKIQKLGDETYNQPLPFPTDGFIQAGIPYDTTFIAHNDGIIDNITLAHAANTLASSSTLNLILSYVPNPTSEQALATASLTADFSINNDLRGDAYTLKLDRPLYVLKGEQYDLRFEIDSGMLVINGATVSNETDFDYGLPFRLDGYDAFSGIYRGDLNLQVYWDDNEEKLNRFVTTLNQTDYIFIATNHQYAQITRLPERYPLTTLYYRELIGCPNGQNIIECYREAQPGDYQGRLGFDLVAIFEAYPKLGPIVINDQAAEESFTFYDHPKVLIFKKSADYNPGQVASILGAVDLANVVHLTPREAASYKSLLLPEDRLAQQRAGGTWSNLFNYDWLQNKVPVVGLVVWYLFVFLLGVLTYPIIRLVMPGLGDKGYALSRTLGLVILAYVPWLLSSVGVPHTRFLIGLVFAAIAVAGISLGWMRRDELLEEWKSNRRYFLLIEGIFLSFFLFDLFIRLGNPDLWHPAKGGERPMDFSYLNAVIKSTTFPPYDPWFAGGYINYYYYGFVLVGSPVKLLGIVPSIAYNFILPTLFAIVATSAFEIGWNLVERTGAKTTESRYRSPFSMLSSLPFIGGFCAALLITVLGNLGTIQMVFQALARLAAPGGDLTDIDFIQRLGYAVEGLYSTIAQGVPLPIGRGEWYWNPSRVIPPGPGNEITEFPFFTFLYSDLHAHMIVLMLATFVIAWALATVRARRSSLISLGIGALVIGALYPTNLSDIYTYLPVGLTALVYATWRASDVPQTGWLPALSPIVKRVILTIMGVGLLTVLSYWFYEPYRAAYSQAYRQLEPWTASRTPIMSYLTHWGLFLFLIFSWLIWETRQWMAATPVSSLGKLKPYRLLIELVMTVLVFILLYLAYRKVWIGWIALPLAAWAGVLILWPDQPDMKRLALFWVGTALLITIVVELYTVRGDIGRMNTIFKFYLQAWTLLAISGGAAFAWLLADIHTWLRRWRNTWQTVLMILFTGAALYTVTATIDKVSDRMNPEAPHTLDSMTYMAYSEYWDTSVMDLSQDYRAIRWMQANVEGSPVIVEANCPEYRWCTRFTIYTGLPGVVGWNWHQRQQRALGPPTLVTDRIDAIGQFYNTTDIGLVQDFLAKYDVHYIVVGQLEQIYYEVAGLEKFEQYEGQLWKVVYRDMQTVIYEVLP